MTMLQNRMVLGTTQSVCPQCLATIPAERVLIGDTVYLAKSCSEHGAFMVPVWRGLETYLRWGRGSRAFSRPAVCATEVTHGCPRDCGLCPDHRQQSCCVLLEVTSRCNIACPVCFASAGPRGVDASLTEIDGWLDTLAVAGSRVHIQLSGGEPTLRDDLATIVRLIRSRGFDFVQLNTNGIRLAQEPAYVAALAQAGLDCVFLQFDGLTDDTHMRLRGARLARLKERAIRSCGETGIGVVLVPTVVPGVNDSQIGAIVDFAIVCSPTVRAVHFQPISYFGRGPDPDSDARITLPEIMQALVDHCGGTIRFDDFHPGSAENPYCSFSGRFTVDDDGRLHAAEALPTSCCGGAVTESRQTAAPQNANPIAERATDCCGSKRPSRDVDRARRYVAGQWRNPGTAGTPSAGLDSFDAFLSRSGRTLGLSGMAFQDAWTLDLDRLRQCYIHVVAPDRRMIPFCAFNLTDQCGRPLYRTVTGPGSPEA
jgi:uncharacterized radical SAM superfamily Fe-S cluster-containing enzyme